MVSNKHCKIQITPIFLASEVQCFQDDDCHVDGRICEESFCVLGMVKLNEHEYITATYYIQGVVRTASANPAISVAAVDAHQVMMGISSSYPILKCLQDVSQMMTVPVVTHAHWESVGLWRGKCC